MAIVKNHAGQSLSNGLTVEATMDAKDSAFLIRTLSSNLYSNRRGAALREVVSNAVDATKEAGNNNPVTVTFYEVDYETHVAIQDFGVGLSDQRFNEVYCKVGASTKRHSDLGLGKYGMGKNSPMAVTDECEIRSVHNGTEVVRLMYKDAGIVKFTELSRMATDKPNGVTISFSIDDISSDRYSRNDSQWASEVWNQLTFFDNVVVKNTTNNHVFRNLAERWEGLKITKYKNFSVANIYSPDRLMAVLGGVPYPIDKSQLPQEKIDNNLIFNASIFINFNIGDLEVPPTRENLDYDQMTVDNLVTAINATCRELDGLYQQQFSGDYTAISDAYSASKDKTINISGTFVLWGGDKAITLNGDTWDDQTTLVYENKRYKDLFSKSGMFRVNEKVSALREYFSYEKLQDATIFKGDLKTYEKAYFRENLYGVLIVESSKSRRHFIHDYIKAFGRCRNQGQKLVRRAMLREYFAKERTAVPQEWIDAEKAHRKSLRKSNVKDGGFWKQNISTNQLRSYGYDKNVNVSFEKLRSRDLPYLLQSNKKALIVFGQKGDEMLTAVAKAFSGDVVCIGVAKSKVKLLEGLPGFLNISDFTPSHPTYEKWLRNNALHNALDGVVDSRVDQIPQYKKLRRAIKEQINEGWVRRHSRLNTDYTLPQQDQKYIDKLSSFVKKWEPFAETIGDIRYNESEVKKIVFSHIVKQIKNPNV